VSDGNGARFQEALRNREVLSLAKGIIMERAGTDEKGAFKSLLRLSLHQGTTLRDRAEAIVRSVIVRSEGPKRGGMIDPAMEARHVLDSYRQEAGLSHGELWLRYFQLGGMIRVRARGVPLGCTRPLAV